MKTKAQATPGEAQAPDDIVPGAGFVQTVLDALGAHIAVLDSDGTIVAVNEAWCRFAADNHCLPDRIGPGINYLEICRTSARLTQDKVIEDIAEGLQGVISAKRPFFNAEYPCDSPTEQRWFTMSVRPLGGPAGGVVVTHENITELKQRELALRQSEALFRNLFENHSAIKLIIDSTTAQIVDANPAAVAFYGWSVEELRGMRMHQINTLPPETIDTELANARCSLRHTFEFRHRRADGSIRDVEVYCNKIRTGERDLLYSIIHDITDRKLAEEARKRLEDRNRHLEKSLSLNRMAGAIAHHFNNQLQAVMMSQELAMNELPDLPRTREYLYMAQGSAREATRVSNLMLTYLGQNALKHLPLDLSATCQTELQQLCTNMPAHVTLLSDLPNPGPRVRSSGQELHQLLDCLITNAWEACGQGKATVRVAIRTCAATEIPTAHRTPISFTPATTDYACIEVSDTGCGVQAQNMSQLFDPFYSTKFAGRGLGLSVVLGIVRAHEGVVTVDSEPGRGTSFCIHLPLADTQA